jgi:hypothetical protein
MQTSSRLAFPIGLLLSARRVEDISIPVPREVPPSIEQALAQDLGAILYELRPYTPSNPLVMRLTPEALALWSEFYQTIPRTVTGTRIDSIALRLAMLMALSAHKLEIDTDVIQAAIEIAKWQLAVREEVMPVEASNAIAALEQRICKTLKSRAAASGARSPTLRARRARWLVGFLNCPLQSCSRRGWCAMRPERRFCCCGLKNPLT